MFPSTRAHRCHHALLAPSYCHLNLLCWAQQIRCRQHNSRAPKSNRLPVCLHAISRTRRWTLPRRQPRVRFRSCCLRRALATHVVLPAHAAGRPWLFQVQHSGRWRKLPTSSPTVRSRRRRSGWISPRIRLRCTSKTRASLRGSSVHTATPTRWKECVAAPVI